MALDSDFGHIALYYSSVCRCAARARKTEETRAVQ